MKTPPFEQLERHAKKIGAWEAKEAYVRILLENIMERPLEHLINSKGLSSDDESLSSDDESLSSDDEFYYNIAKQQDLCKKAAEEWTNVEKILSELLADKAPKHYRILAQYINGVWRDVLDKPFVDTFYKDFLKACESDYDKNSHGFLDNVRIIAYMRTACQRLREIYPYSDKGMLDALNQMKIVKWLDKQPDNMDTNNSTILLIESKSPAYMYNVMRNSHDLGSLKGEKYIKKLTDLLSHPELTYALRAKIYYQIINTYLEMMAKSGNYQNFQNALPYIKELTHNPEMQEMDKAKRVRGAFKYFSHLYSKEGLFQKALEKYLESRISTFNICVFEEIEKQLKNPASAIECRDDKRIKLRLAMLQSRHWLAKAVKNGNMSDFKRAFEAIKDYWWSADHIKNGPTLQSYVPRLQDYTERKSYTEYVNWAYGDPDGLLEVMSWFRTLFRFNSKTQWVQHHALEIDRDFFPDNDSLVDNYSGDNDLDIIEKFGLKTFIQTKEKAVLKTDALKISANLQAKSGKGSIHPIVDDFFRKPICTAKQTELEPYVRAQAGWRLFSEGSCKSESKDSIVEMSESVQPGASLTV